jgi:DNA-binding response OmpR family regulator
LSVFFYLIADLMFATRVEDVAKHLGYRAVVLTPDDDVQALLARESPRLVIVALDADNWANVVHVAKKFDVPVLAYGSHKNVEQMVAAKNAGCDEVVARSRIAAELPNLMKKYLGS